MRIDRVEISRHWWSPVVRTTGAVVCAYAAVWGVRPDNVEALQVIPTPTIAGAATATGTAEPSPTVFRIPTAEPQRSVTPGPIVDVKTTPVSTPTVVLHADTPSPTVAVITTALIEASVTPVPTVEVKTTPVPTSTVRPHTPTPPISTETPLPTSTAVYPTPAFHFIYPPQPTQTEQPTRVPIEATETPIVPTPTRVSTQTPPRETPAVGAGGAGRAEQTQQSNTEDYIALGIFGGLAAAIPAVYLRRRNHVR